MSPVDLAGPDAGTDFTLYSYQKFQPGFRDEKGQILEIISGAKLEKRSKHDEQQKYHSFGNF